MTLPFLISVPHAGWRVPKEVEDYCILTHEQIEAHGDTGAREIFNLGHLVDACVTTEIARAIVDLNRAADDRQPDGVVKTRTWANESVYDPMPDEEVFEQLIERHYHPYHARLTQLSRRDSLLGIDCHTVAPKGLSTMPSQEAETSWIRLSNGNKTCPKQWIESLCQCFERSFGERIAIDHPARGGHITAYHSREMPWIRLEVSRDSFATGKEKRECIVAALAEWVDEFVPKLCEA